MKLSLSTEYAIHSLFYLALQGSQRLVLVQEIAKTQNISESYLAKVFQVLTKAGLVKSFRGPKGGYLLARKPSDISLKIIVETMEGKTPIFKCDGQKRNCDFLGDCIIKDVMSEAENRMYEVLENTNLADLLVRLKINLFSPTDVINKIDQSLSFWGNQAEINEKR